MKKLYTLIAFAILNLVSTQLFSQITCNPSGNLWVYASYDGGVLNINVDVNIPNIKIGVCTYEPVTINISGAYASNVTEVRYAGYVSTNNFHCSNSPATTTINSPSGVTSVNFLPPSTLSNPNGYSNIVCGFTCSTTTNQGGCNTADQIKSYFQTTTGGTLVSYYTQYGCWSSSPYALSAGGNCCSAVPSCFINANAGSNQTMCAGDQVTLSGSATGGATVYSWSPTAGLSNPNSATTTASPTVTTTYVLTAGDGSSCSDVDSVVVTVNPLPVVNLGADTMVCGSSLLLDAGTQPNGSFLWSNSSSAQTLNVTSSGSYHVSVTNTSTGCTDGDTISVTFNSPPSVNLGNDTSICGDNLQLNAGNPGSTYLWSNNSSQQSIVAFTTGTYSVVVTDANGCTGTDVIVVTFNQIPVVSFLFGLPVVCLADQPYTLNTGSPAGGIYSGTGVNAGTFDPAVAGIGTFGITYTYTDSAGCTSSATDSLMVDACMGVNSHQEICTSVFPNPSSGIFSINVSSNCRATLLNSLGAVVQESMFRTGTNEMGKSDLAPGIYYLILVTNNSSETVRIVVAEEK